MIILIDGQLTWLWMKKLIFTRKHDGDNGLKGIPWMAFGVKLIWFRVLVLMCVKEWCEVNKLASFGFLDFEA